MKLFPAFLSRGRTEEGVYHLANYLYSRFTFSKHSYFLTRKIGKKRMLKQFNEFSCFKLSVNKSWSVNKGFLHDDKTVLVSPTGCDCHVRQNGRSGFRTERNFSLTLARDRRDFRVIKSTRLPMPRDHFVQGKCERVLSIAARRD